MRINSIRPTVLNPSTLVGLALPLIGMPVWYWIGGSGLLTSLDRTTRVLIGSLVTAGLALGVIAVALAWEKNPLAALGFRRQTRRSIIIALAASIVIAVGGTLLSLLLITALGLPMPTLLTDTFKAFPLGVSIWVVVSGSIAEEVLYRGFVLERLGQLTGNIWLGGLITLIWFSALHLPLGAVYTLTIVLPNSILITLLYIWRRDLVTTIIVHFVFNAPIIAASILDSIAGA